MTVKVRRLKCLVKPRERLCPPDLQISQIERIQECGALVAEPGCDRYSSISEPRGSGLGQWSEDSALGLEEEEELFS